MEETSTGRVLIGEILVKRSVITQDQLEVALNLQKKRKRFYW